LKSKSKNHCLAILAGLLLAVNVASSASLIGAPAPDFALPSLQQGNLRLSEYRSQVVVLTFWASWCTRCNQALPLYKSLYRQYQAAGLNVFSVAIDGEADVAEKLVKDFGLEFPVLLDRDHQVSRLYDLGKMPVTVVIDREGEVVFIDSGFRGDSIKRIAAEVSELMEE
jgi:peroxiredoxin